MGESLVVATDCCCCMCGRLQMSFPANRQDITAQLTMFSCFEELAEMQKLLSRGRPVEWWMCGSIRTDACMVVVVKKKQGALKMESEAL